MKISIDTLETRQIIVRVWRYSRFLHRRKLLACRADVNLALHRGGSTALALARCKGTDVSWRDSIALAGV